MKTWYQKIGAAILLCLLCLYSNTNFGSSILFKHYTDIDGLPQNSIKAIVKDRLGYVWIATENGLCRYDGQHLKAYVDTTLMSTRFWNISPGPNQTFYAITEFQEVLKIEDGRVSKLKNDFLINKRYNYSKKHVSILDIQQFFTGTNQSLNYIGYDIKSKAIILDQGNQITKLSRQFMPNIFVLKGQLYSLDNKLNIHPIKNEEMALDNESKKEELKLYFLKSNTINHPSIFISNNKAYIIRVIGDKITCLELVKNLPTTLTFENCLYDEKLNTLILGSSTNGLFVYKINTGILLPSQAKERSYTAQVLADENLIFSVNKITGLDTVYNPNKYIDSVYHYVLLKDHFNNIYYPRNYSHGIYVTDNVFNNVKPKKIFNEDCPVFMVEDPKYRIWICDKTTGLSIYDNRNINNKPCIKRYSQFINPKGNLAYNKFNNTYTLAHKHSLYQFDEQLNLIDSIPLKPNLQIRNLYFSNTGVLWVTSYGAGIFCIKNREIIRLPLDKKKHLLFSHCVFQDNLNNYWITSNKGLFKISSKLIDNYLFSEQKGNINFYYYSTYDGLKTNEFNGGCYPCMLDMQNGYYSLPTISGLVWINPQMLKDIEITPNILIDEIVADNNVYYLTGSTTLNALPSRLTINLSMVYWGNPENIEIEYLLEGADKVWSKLPQLYSINYGNLSGGIHILKIRIKNHLYPDNYIYKEFEIILPLRYYQKWWFYILCIIGLIALVFTIVYYRTMKIQRLNSELEKQIAERTLELRLQNKMIIESYEELEKNQELLDHSISLKDRAMAIFSHNIVGPLKFITVLTDFMSKGNTSIDIEKVKTIDQTAKSLLQHSKDLLIWVKTQDENYKPSKAPVELRKFILQKIELFKAMAESANIKFDIQIDEKTLLYSDKQLLKIIFYNLIDNALKYSHNGTITIRAKSGEHSLVIDFIDTGTGMNAHQVDKLNSYSIPSNRKKYNSENKDGFGIGWYIIADCLILLSATYTIKSELEKGTQITLNFPIEG